MKIGVEMGPMKMTLPVTTTMDGNISQDFLQVLPKVSLRYQCTPETFTYVSVAKGYKTGGYNVQMFGDLVQVQAKYDLMSKFAPDKAEQPGEVKDIASYKPEHSWNYEAGIRSELVRGRLSAELTFFYMDIRDLQLTSFAENGSGRMITNGGKANSYGVGTEPAQPYHGRTHRRPQLRFYPCHFPRLHLHGQGREQPDRENGLQG